MEILVKTLAGLEDVLAQELTELGAQGVEPLKRAVRCQGDHALLYRINLWVRTGLRVLVPVANFVAAHENDLYAQLRAIDWSRYMQLHQTFAIDVVTQSARMRHSHFLALKTKDALVDWFRDKTGQRPSVSTDNADIRFHVHIDSTDRVTLLLDSSGDGLHRRGYRTDGGEAPLNEVLAAGLVKLSGWQPHLPLVDMMCGSGTILIEGGLMATRTAPGLNRSFAFEQWLDFSPGLWRDILADARAARRPHDVPIIGVDNNFRAIRIAENNIAAAHLQDTVRVQRTTFQSYLPPLGPGTLISNPPYDLRLESDDIVGLYREIGDKLKKDFANYQAWLLSGNIPALKQVGLKPSRRIALLNGTIECKFYAFELYTGSKRIPTEDVEQP